MTGEAIMWAKKETLQFKRKKNRYIAFYPSSRFKGIGKTRDEAERNLSLIYDSLVR